MATPPNSTQLIPEVKRFLTLSIPPTLSKLQAPSMVLHVSVIFLQSCLPVFVWQKVLTLIFNPKQLRRVPCILRCHYSKCYSIILQNVSLWCFIFLLHYALITNCNVSHFLKLHLFSNSTKPLEINLLESPTVITIIFKFFCVILQINYECFSCHILLLTCFSAYQWRISISLQLI